MPRQTATHCRHGHLLTDDNVRLVPHHARGYVERRCITCETASGQRKGYLQKLLGKRKPATRCKQGHKLEGDNVLLIMRQNGRPERRCRICNRKRRGDEPSLLECQAEMVRTRALFALDDLYERASTWWEKLAIRERRRRLEVG